MLKEFDLDYEVCNCLKVSINDIVNSIETKEVKSLRDLQEVTKAGTQCRHCIFPEGDFGIIKKKIYCKTILNEVLNG
ncbi:MAG: (2Fe-2S)-binding protein [Campylobacteraceae bacterium]|nr:(2Fe-2S)-binding protein [Campylobacteraceae bacterium]